MGRDGLNSVSVLFIGATLRALHHRHRERARVDRRRAFGPDEGAKSGYYAQSQQDTAERRFDTLKSTGHTSSHDDEARHLHGRTVRVCTSPQSESGFPLPSQNRMRQSHSCPTTTGENTNTSVAVPTTVASS